MRYLTIIFCAVLVLFSLHQAQARIIHVPADSSTIQGGIYGAVNGDTVLVAPGTYHEHINFNGKAILVTSETGPEITIISKLYDGFPMVTFDSAEDSNSVLDGFTIQNANNDVLGGAISCYDGSSPTISNNILKNNSTRFGGGVCCKVNCSPIIKNNRIVGNHTTYHGAGVYCANSSSPAIINNQFIQNTADLEGSSIACEDNCLLTIHNNLMIENSGTSVINLWGSSAVILNNTLDRNTSVNASIYCAGPSPDIKNTIVSNELLGYGIYAKAGSGSPSITYCDVWNNAAGDYHGCTSGVGCISADPLFCDTTAGDYRLQPSSPCGGAGQGGADIGALGWGCGGVVLTPGPDQSGPANSQVSVTFYIQNIEAETDTFNLNVSDALGWEVTPTYEQTVLEPGQQDSIAVTVSVPFVISGTIDVITLLAASRTDSLVWGNASLLVRVSGRIIAVPSEFATIQQAINASGAGDTVLVAPGTYYEHISFNGKPILVKSEKGADSTIIRKAYGGVSMVSFVSQEDSNSVLDGFTITGAYIESGQGAGIRCYNSSPKILNNKITSNLCHYGAGIDCDNYSSPLIAYNVLQGNTAYQGGGIRCNNHSSPVVLENTIVANSADASGAGIWCGDHCSPIVRKNSFMWNTARDYGGGIGFNGCSPTITENLVVGNSAYYGGGIALLASLANITSNTMDRNSAYKGGGIYMDASSPATILNTIVTNSTWGKGIRAEGCSPNIIYCDVWNNLDENYYGCIPGQGCISADPIYCDTAYGDYHLAPLSPCVATGQGGANIGAFGVGCAGDLRVDVTSGPDKAGRASTDISVKFYIKNRGHLADTYAVNVSDSLSWNIAPLYYEVTLDSSQLDSVLFTVSIPAVPIGTSNRIFATATSQTDSTVWDSASLTVTCNALIEGIEVTAGSNQSGYADSTVSVTFLVQNVGVVVDSYSLDIWDTRGWNIVPLHYDLVLDTAETEPVSFTVFIPYVSLGTLDQLTLLAVSKTNPLARDSASLNITCNAYVEGWNITAGSNLSSPAHSQVTAQFYVQNTGLARDSCYLHVADSLGWFINPQNYRLSLNPGQRDSVFFNVQIPSVPVGTTNKIILAGHSLTNPYVADTTFLLVLCSSYNVTITNISDIGNDQGKQVHIDWSSFPGSDPLVTNFSVFRRKDSLLTSLPDGSPVDPNLLLTYPPGQWEWLFTIPAFGETLYSVVVPTLKDSTIAEGMYWSVFFIRAGTDNPTIYFDSPVDSGYSLDNLFPSPPMGLLASHAPAVTKLTWNTTPIPDFDYHTVYRDTIPGFTPCLSNRLGFTIDTTFVDSTAQLGRTCYYLVTATDFSGNESDPSNEAMGLRYITGDANTDGEINIADIVYLINYLFIGGPPPTPLVAGDANCDGKTNVVDVVYLINYLFIGGPPPGC